MRLAAQKSLGDFYMYNGMEGDQRYARMIDESVQEADARLKELTEMPGDGSKALRVQLGEQWKDYSGELTNLVVALKTGFHRPATHRRHDRPQPEAAGHGQGALREDPAGKRRQRPR